MQLILESESTLVIDRDMSTIEDIPTGKVGNIENPNEKNCNGNKETNEDVKVDDEMKTIVNEGSNELGNIPIENTLQGNGDAEPNNLNEINAGNSEIESLDTNDAHIEESQVNGKDEDVYSKDIINEEKEMTTEEDINSKQIVDKEIPESIDKDLNSKDVADQEIKIKPDVEKCDEDVLDREMKLDDVVNSVDTTDNEVLKATSSEGVVQDEEDLIVTKKENSIQILDMVEKEPDNITSQTGELALKEEIPCSKDDVEIIEELTEDPVIETAQADSVESASKIASSENVDIIIDESKNVSETLNCDTKDVVSSPGVQESSPIELKDDMDDEEVVDDTSNNQDSLTQVNSTTIAPSNKVATEPIVCKLSNTLDILSDDEEDTPKEETPMEVDTNAKQCINIEDDDDIMLIDEDTSKTETPQAVDISNKEETPVNIDVKTDSETGEKTIDETIDLFEKKEEKESTPPVDTINSNLQININEKQEIKENEVIEPKVPLLPDNFLKTAKKNLSDMTREDLEEFCILKIVESIVDRSNLSEIKNKLKTMAQGIEEYRKKAMMLTKQNRDLQVVLKSVQEEQKKMTPDTPITPLKITRSVGMQVFMEKSGARRKNLAQLQNATNNTTANRQNIRTGPAANSRPQKQPASNQPNIPVPRLVPANSPAVKSPNTVPIVNQVTPTKTASTMPNGIKNPSPSQKVPEKRSHNRVMSVTVDLTDDEPPTKMNNRTSPAASPSPVRLVPPQNLMAPRQPFATAVNNQRKVYIPISGPQNQGIRPGQTIMLKTVPTPGLRPRCPTPQAPRAPTGQVRMNRIQTGRHPAPLPDAMKQYQPPNWKALPPAPDLKLSKVENGIVISWKIEGYQEDSYEEIASYQLYAYQETSSPPSTSLWKKIGDVKALPLPMACTLTQFMAGFKYYFAVRAVDIRSRLGPFSLPGSILLLNKL